jgi:hypothetical protein
MSSSAAWASIIWGRSGRETSSTLRHGGERQVGSKGPRLQHPGLCIRNLLQRASAALEKRAFVRRAPENGHQALCRRTQLRFVGFLGIVLVHGMCEPQSVARFRYAHVEGVLPQPAVSLHQDSVRSAPVDGTPGLDKIV